MTITLDDPLGHADLAAAVGSLYSSSSYDDFGVTISELFGRKGHAEVVPVAGRFPAVGAWNDSNSFVLCAAGVSTRSHAQAWMEGYGNLADCFGVCLSSPYLFQWARLFLPAADLAWKAGRRNYVFSGHSAGGAMATLLAVLFKARHPEAKIRLVTFGSPRAVSANSQWGLPTFDVWRYMRMGDTVCLMPPRLGDNGFGSLLLPEALLIVWGTYCHSPGGILLLGNGLMVDAVAPLGFVSPPSTDILAYLFGLDPGLVVRHSVQGYEQELRLWKPSAKPSPAIDDFESPAERPMDEQVTVARLRLAEQFAGLIP